MVDGPVAGEGSVVPIWYDGPAAMLRMPIVILFVSASGDRVESMVMSKGVEATMPQIDTSSEG